MDTTRSNSDLDITDGNIEMFKIIVCILIISSKKSWFSSEIKGNLNIKKPKCSIICIRITTQSGL